MDYYEIQLKSAWVTRCLQRPDLANAQFIRNWLTTLENQGAINQFTVEEDGDDFIVGFSDGADWGTKLRDQRASRRCRSANGACCTCHSGPS